MALNYFKNQPLAIGVSLLHITYKIKKDYPIVVVTKYKYQQTSA
jgi:hypothetical protein